MCLWESPLMPAVTCDIWSSLGVNIIQKRKYTFLSTVVIFFSLILSLAFVHKVMSSMKNVNHKTSAKIDDILIKTIWLISPRPYDRLDWVNWSENRSMVAHVDNGVSVYSKWWRWRLFKSIQLSDIKTLTRLTFWRIYSIFILINKMMKPKSSLL